MKDLYLQLWILLKISLEQFPQKRNSRSELFCKKGVLRNFTKITRKYLRRSLFFNKVAGLRLGLQLYWKRNSSKGSSLWTSKNNFWYNTFGDCFWKNHWSILTSTSSTKSHNTFGSGRPTNDVFSLMTWHERSSFFFMLSSIVFFCQMHKRSYSKSCVLKINDIKSIDNSKH